jgi:hypothetical protein
MSTARVVRYQTNAGSAEENHRLVAQVYAELNADKPEGLRYVTFRLDDGVSFIHVALLDTDTNPLFSTEAFRTFQEGLPDRLVAPPQTSSATIVGSYGF